MTEYESLRNVHESIRDVARRVDGNTQMCALIPDLKDAVKDTEDKVQDIQIRMTELGARFDTLSTQVLEVSSIAAEVKKIMDGFKFLRYIVCGLLALGAYLIPWKDLFSAMLNRD